MSATGTLISLDEYLSTGYDPDREFVDGELIERNMGESDHSALQGAITSILYAQRKRTGTHAFPELRVQVSATRFRIPDVLLTKQKVRGKILREPPFLCIEILSPTDRASRMGVKIDDYLAFGVQYVWVIDSRSKTARSYTSDGRSESSLLLKTSDPEITLALDEIFAEMSEDLED